jgi:hemerythrin
MLRAPRTKGALVALIQWQDSLDTGIEVIDIQHRRILAMINELHHVHTKGTHAAVMAVIDEMADYTISHFAFEEALMEDAGYTFASAHKRIHELFAKRVQEYRARAAAGEDVVGELKGMLSRWLSNHIRTDDGHYVGVVREHMNALAQDTGENGWLRRALGRFFR